MSIKIALGLKIKELRKRAKLSQEKFSEMIEMNPRQIVRIENGESFPTAENLEKIASTLNVSPQELFYNEAYISDEILKEEIKKSLDNLNSKELRMIFTVIKNI